MRSATVLLVCTLVLACTAYSSTHVTSTTELTDDELNALKMRAVAMKSEKFVGNGGQPEPLFRAPEFNNDEIQRDFKIAKEIGDLNENHLNNLKSKDINSHFDANAEIAAKKAYLAKLRMQEQLDKEKAKDSDGLFNIEKFHVKEDKELKKLVMKEKFDDWFDALFKRLYTEMFGEDGQLKESFITSVENTVENGASSVASSVAKSL